jgi:hypothetical protein
VMKKWLFCFLICGFQFSCADKSEIKMIPQKELIPLLVDLNLADAISGNSQLTSQLGSIDSASFYGPIYLKHRHTKQELDKTLLYYSNKPNKLAQIYDEVFAELSRQTEKVKSTLKDYAAFENKTIWRSNTKIKIDADTEAYPQALDIRIDSIGQYLINAEIKMGKSDQSTNPKITAYFYDSLKNDLKSRIFFREFPLAKSDVLRTYQLVEEVKNPALSHLHIIIPDCDSTSLTFRRNIEISNISVIRLRVKKSKKS